LECGGRAQRRHRFRTGSTPPTALNRRSSISQTESPIQLSKNIPPPKEPGKFHSLPPPRAHARGRAFGDGGAMPRIPFESFRGKIKHFSTGQSSAFLSCSGLPKGRDIALRCRRPRSSGRGRACCPDGVAADVRRLKLDRERRSEPPYVGCYDKDGRRRHPFLRLWARSAIWATRPENAPIPRRPVRSLSTHDGIPALLAK